MQDYWIKPNGELIKVQDMGHNDYASDLLEKEMGFEAFRKYLRKNEDRVSYPYEVLHLRGWVRVKRNWYEPKTEILGGCIDLTKPMRNTMDPSMTSAQIHKAKILCEETGTLLHNAINDKRFW